MPLGGFHVTIGLGKIAVSASLQAQVSNLITFNSFKYVHTKLFWQTVTAIYTATLKDVGDNEILLHQRVEQLRHRQELYKWQKFPETGIPSGIDDSTEDLPLDERFEEVKDVDFDSGGAKMLICMGLEEGIANLLKENEVKELREYEKLADVLGSTRPLYEAGRWATDVEFGRQMLNGVNPIVITKCTELSSNFPVTEEMVKPLLNRGLSLEEEMKVRSSCHSA